MNPIGWWSNNNLGVAHHPHGAATGTASCNTADFAFHHHHHHHHHSMLSHAHGQLPQLPQLPQLAQSPAANPHRINPQHGSPPLPPVSAAMINPHANPAANPNPFQHRVAAALLKTHATLASRRCRRCRCPNCQVMLRLLSNWIHFLFNLFEFNFK